MKFRQLDIRQRKDLYFCHAEDKDKIFNTDYDNISDLMIENSIGYLPIPIGAVLGMKINQKEYRYLPLATEEPSIIAGLSKSLKIIENINSYSLQNEFISYGSVYIKNPNPDFEEIILKSETAIKNIIDDKFVSMKNRGGGFRYLKTKLLQENILSIQIYYNCCDSMGANVINSVLEYISPYLVSKLGGLHIMSILSNDYSLKLIGADFKIPLDLLGVDIAKKIIVANSIAKYDKSRKVTHIKGILNGIEAFALATGQDTRAISSSILDYSNTHDITDYYIEDNFLTCKITLPSGFGLISKTINFHPMFSYNIKMLELKDVVELSQIAVSIGLVQNFTALRALVSDGINKGHIRLHNKK